MSTVVKYNGWVGHEVPDPFSKLNEPHDEDWN